MGEDKPSDAAVAAAKAAIDKLVNSSRTIVSIALADLGEAGVLDPARRGEKVAFELAKAQKALREGD